MLSTALTVLPVFLIILAGYAAGKTGIVPAEYAQVINRFVVHIPLPALMFHIVATSDWHQIWNGDYVITMLASGLSMFAIGALIGKWSGQRPADMAICGLNASYQNAGYLGLPLLILAVGPQSAPYSVIAFSLGLGVNFAASIFMIEMSLHHDQGKLHALGKSLVALLRNPVTAPPILGLLWWLIGIEIPPFLNRTLELLGNSASPTALAGIGLLLAQQPLRNAIGNRTALALTFSKLVLHPAIAAVIALALLAMPWPLARIAILQAAMPTGTGPFMLSGLYRRDGVVTSGTILLSTVISVITITAILTLFPE